MLRTSALLRGSMRRGPTGAASPSPAALVLLLTASNTSATRAVASSSAAAAASDTWAPPSAEAALDDGRTWDQSTRLGRHKRRLKVRNLVSQLSFEYSFLRFLCQKSVERRQWTVRDDFCRMSPGIVELSPSMQAAYMRIATSKPKHDIRAALRDVVPVLKYRNTGTEQNLFDRDDAPEKLIPMSEPDTLNAKKREMWERRDDSESPYMGNKRYMDPLVQAKFRRKVRERLLKFQRQLAIANAAASRSVLYSEEDATGYFLYRGPAVYAGVHRALYELSKMLPWFVPKTMLDFGAGTGTAIQAAKEVYDPGNMAHPLPRGRRLHHNYNAGAAAWSLQQLRSDLEVLRRSTDARKAARFMAVAKLIERGDIDLAEIPADLRGEIAKVAQSAATSAKERRQDSRIKRLQSVVDGTEWTDDLSKKLDEENEADEADIDFEDNAYTDLHEDADAAAARANKPNSAQGNTKTWWEQYVQDESARVDEKIQKRLKPLQQITAVEPSPGMMEIAMNVLQEDAPNVSWRRFLIADEIESHDLVVAAYSLSEIASAAERKRIVQQLWKNTKGVLVLVEHANLPNFDLMMEARDTLLEFKNVGLWDWQPTIVGPCPHEKRCPLRHSSAGVRRVHMRVCKTETRYRPTFIDSWVDGRAAADAPFRSEEICYLIVARNEMIPERAERKAAEEREAKAKAAMAAKEQQQELRDASLRARDKVFERLSDEVVDAPIQVGDEGADDSSAGIVAAAGDAASGTSSTKSAVITKQPGGSAGRSNWLSYPAQVAPASHRYNNAVFIDQAFATQRPISPSEMLVVRAECNDIRSKIVKDAARYHRIVEDSRFAGRVQCTLCTNEGDLVHAKIYRRHYGDKDVQQQLASGLSDTLLSEHMWQFVGGWHLAKKAKAGWLFPSDVPLFAVQKFEQLERPNTLVNRKMSAVEATAMSHGETTELAAKTDDERIVADEAEAEKQQRSKSTKSSDADVPQWWTKETVEDRRVQSMRSLAEQMSGRRSMPAEAFDSRSKISSQAWADAVKAAKRRGGGNNFRRRK